MNLRKNLDTTDGKASQCIADIIEEHIGGAVTG